MSTRDWGSIHDFVIVSHEKLTSNGVFQLIAPRRRQYTVSDFRPATKFLLQLKQKIKFTKLKPTINITIVPLYKQWQFHFLHQGEIKHI